jgi:DNA helicase-2/ATP-dependent DNA helicase PcrA
MVDEYQDTNIIQDRMIQALVNPNNNIMVVGDDSQSIYSFRGANYENIMSFPSRYPNTKVVTLTQNYRSTQSILDLTNAIISKASKKFSKTLTSTHASTIKPVHVSTRNETEQSRFICQKLTEICDEFQIDVSDIAVLMRSGWHSNHLELELSSQSIPFVKYGGNKFIESAHIKDVIAFFRLFYNPSDQLSWQRVLLLCPGLGVSNASRIIKDIQNSVNTASEFPLHRYAKKSYVSSLLTFINCIFSCIDGCSLTTIYDRILTVYQPVFQLIYDDFILRQADLDGFTVLIERFDNLEHLLSEMSLDPPSTHSNLDCDTLTLSTIHSAKGLEWHTVFILSCIDGFIPSIKSFDVQDQIEEERRLLYVALTRAKVNLFIMNPKTVRSMQFKYKGNQFPIESRFLRDFLKTNRLLDKWCTAQPAEGVPELTIDASFDMNTDSDSAYNDAPQSDQSNRRRYYF